MATRRRTQLSLHRGYALGRFQAMGSPCELLIDTTDIELLRTSLQVAADEAWRIEDKFSRYLAGNVVEEINQNAGQTIRVDRETAGLLDFAAELTELSDGRFDITSGVLREVWRFDGSDKVPDADAVDAVLERVGWHKVSWNTPYITLQHGMQIDLGGIGKEYAVDKTAALLTAQTDRAFLINYGGDIVAHGAPQQSQGWQVGIESVAQMPGKASKTIRLNQGGIATSGDARRFLEKDGERYSHILDPVSGWPVRHAPRSITVAADTCTQAGSLATLAMLRGNAAEEFLATAGVQFWCYRQ